MPLKTHCELRQAAWSFHISFHISQVGVMLAPTWKDWWFRSRKVLRSAPVGSSPVGGCCHFFFSLLLLNVRWSTVVQKAQASASDILEDILSSVPSSSIYRLCHVPQALFALLAAVPLVKGANTKCLEKLLWWSKGSYTCCCTSWWLDSSEWSVHVFGRHLLVLDCMEAQWSTVPENPIIFCRGRKRSTSGEKRGEVLQRSGKWDLRGEAGLGQMTKGSQGSRPRSAVSGDTDIELLGTAIWEWALITESLEG